MPRQASIAVENSFVKGLITEATALNFPENACTETINCVFDIIGSVERRLGFDQEFVDTNVGTGKSAVGSRAGLAQSQYKWKNVSGAGDVNVLVVQLGRFLYFYRSSSAGLGNGLSSTSLDLTGFSNAPDSSVDVNEATYSNNSKNLVVTHPLCDPFAVSFDTTASTVTAQSLILKIRDFEGDTADPNTVRLRPTTTSGSNNVHHKYNLYNQGWRDTELTTWDTARTDMPSNGDVWWSFKVPVATGGTTLDVFNTSDIANHETGNSPAPKGHFILTAWDKNRDAVTATASTAGEIITALSGVTASNTGDFRPTTSAFFAGRIFYSGIPYQGYSSDIYFSQIIERDDQFSKCYQDNDPTAEELHDLLPTDGGVIKIPEAGRIVHLFAMTGNLVAFATNGIWLVTGSTGLGFTANDYVVQKISTINAISPSSFVDVEGYPMWWNSEGIYALTAPPAGGTMPVVKPMTLGTIQTYYDNIPPENKPYARGCYHPVERTVQWLFNKDVTGGNLEDRYIFRDILIFNVISSAWYPWSCDSNANITFSGVSIMDGIQGFTTVNNVIATATTGTPNVVDASTNQVITYGFSATSAIGLAFKYTVIDNTNKLYFAETRNLFYLDWGTLNYDSSFVTGYKLRGSGILKQQATWLQLYADTSGDVFNSNNKILFDAGWNYSDISGDGLSSVNQVLTFNDVNNYNNQRLHRLKDTKRIKVRGHGKAVQFRVRSIDNSPFRLDGWVTFDTKNSIP